MTGGNSLNDHAAAGDGEGESEGIADLAALAKAVGRNGDSYTRQLIGEAIILDTLPEALVDRINAALRTGKMPEAAASLLRLMSGQLGFRLKEIALEVAGTQGVLHAGADPVGSFTEGWLGARIGTVAGGSQEMQRNGISERLLGLPREATPDRGVPFSEVLAMRRQHS
jgi:alkylation response protein AidB-like acyl-CoA dehydrogenase